MYNAPFWYQQYFPIPDVDAKSLKQYKRLNKWNKKQEYQEIYMWLTNIFLNLFEWTLPSTCLERALERTIFFEGSALFFRDNNISDKGEMPDSVYRENGTNWYWHTPYTAEQGLNIYYEPNNRIAYSFEFNKKFNMDNSVIIRNNAFCFPSCITVDIYTQKILSAQKTCDTVSANLKTPYVVMATDDNFENAADFMKKLRNDEDAIIQLKGGFKTEDIEVVQTGVNPAALNSAWENKQNLISEIFGRMGIETSHDTGKKERLVVAEATGNNGPTKASIDVMLEARQKSCDEINELFKGELDEPVSVRLKNEEELDALLSTPMPTRAGQPANDA